MIGIYQLAIIYFIASREIYKNVTFLKVSFYIKSNRIFSAVSDLHTSKCPKCCESLYSLGRGFKILHTEF